MYTFHKFTTSFAPSFPYSFAAENYEFKSIVVLPTNKTITHTHTARTSQCKNNIVIVNCFRCNSHIILNTPILYANKIYQHATCLPWAFERISFRMSFCFLLYCSRCMQIVAFTDEIITLLPLLHSIWRNIFSHTVCVIFIGVVIAGGGAHCCKCKWVHPEKTFANSQ